MFCVTHKDVAIRRACGSRDNRTVIKYIIRIKQADDRLKNAALDTYLNLDLPRHNINYDDFHCSPINPLHLNTKRITSDLLDMVVRTLSSN